MWDPAALILLTLHHTRQIPQYVFRKLLHIPAFCSAAVIAWRAGNWQVTSLTLILFAVIIYPILYCLQSWKGYSSLFVEKKFGEIKKSLLLLFLTDAALVAFCGGIFGEIYVAVTAILMWGTGDGTAALVGKRIGKHHVKIRFADPKKTWEGSFGMLVVSLAVGFASVMLQTNLSLPACLVTAVVTVAVGTYVELISHNGNDTATVPIANMLVLLVLSHLL